MKKIKKLGLTFLLFVLMSIFQIFGGLAREDVNSRNAEENSIWEQSLKKVLTLGGYEIQTAEAALMTEACCIICISCTICTSCTVCTSCVACTSCTFCTGCVAGTKS